MYRLFRFLLFFLDAETAHHLVTSSLKKICQTPLGRNFIKKAYGLESPKLETSHWGLKFKNPVGLAAGFDKNGDYIEAMSAVGFGFIEVGTVTPLPQKGNPKPRLFRLKKDRSILNRMGFNNHGLEYLIENLKRLKHHDIIIGGNIGKNKSTPNDLAWKDYLICFDGLYPYVDYFVVNLSSPNTPGLRELQEREPLIHLLSVLVNDRKKRTQRKPILLKIAPDLSSTQIEEICDVVHDSDIDGIIATNTTIQRDQLSYSESYISSLGNGGISGDALENLSNQKLVETRKSLKKEIPIIGVGGIGSPQKAKTKFQKGAALIQIYSGLIYYGPHLVKDIKRLLLSQYR